MNEWSLSIAIYNSLRVPQSFMIKRKTKENLKLGRLIQNKHKKNGIKLQNSSFTIFVCTDGGQTSPISREFRSKVSGLRWLKVFTAFSLFIWTDKNIPVHKCVPFPLILWLQETWIWALNFLNINIFFLLHHPGSKWAKPELPVFSQVPFTWPSMRRAVLIRPSADGLDRNTRPGWSSTTPTTAATRTCATGPDLLPPPSPGGSGCWLPSPSCCPEGPHLEKPQMKEKKLMDVFFILPLKWSHHALQIRSNQRFKQLSCKRFMVLLYRSLF